LITSFLQLVSSTFRRALRTPASRMVAVLVAMFVFPTLAKSHTFLMLLLLGFFTAMELSLGRRLIEVFNPLKRRMLRAILRYTVYTRHTISLSPGLEFLYLLALTVAIGGTMLGILEPKYLAGVNAVLLTAAAIMAVAGAADFIRMFAKLAKIGWTRATGKAIYALIAGLGYLAGGTLARDLVGHASGRDPKFFSDVVTLVQVILSPLAAVWLCIAVISSVAVLVFGGVVFGTFVFQTIRLFWRSTLTSPAPRKRAPLSHRLLHGSRADFRPSIWEWETVVFSVRPVAIAGFAMAILVSYNWFGQIPHETVDKVVKELLVSTEFLSGQTCGDRTMVDPIAHLDRGNILVARRDTTGLWKFQPDDCESKAKEDAQTAPAAGISVKPAVAASGVFTS